jgi:hypothetical protein
LALSRTIKGKIRISRGRATIRGVRTIMSGGATTKVITTIGWTMSTIGYFVIQKGYELRNGFKGK